MVQENQKRPRGNPALQKWMHKETKPMRVPVVFHDILKEVAEKLDRGIYTPDSLRDLIAEDIKRTKAAIARNMAAINSDKS